MASHGFINNESCLACLDDPETSYEVKNKQTNKLPHPLMPHLMGTSPACINMNLHPLHSNGGPCQLPGISS